MFNGFLVSAASHAEVDVAGERGDQWRGTAERPEVVEAEAAPREAGRQLERPSLSLKSKTPSPWFTCGQQLSTYVFDEKEGSIARAIDAGER